MNALLRLLERWWRPLLFLAWFLTLSGLLAERRYATFLRPEFAAVLAMGAFVALAFLVIDLMDPRPRRLDFAGFLNVMVLLLPLICVLNVQDATLDTYAFHKRWSAKAMAARPTVKIERATTTNGPDAATTLETTLLELLDAPEKHVGKTVSFDGMIHHRKDVQQEFGDNACLAFRFLVNCCVADAIPLAVVVTADSPIREVDNDWVRITGIFELRQQSEGLTPLVRHAELKAIPPSGTPYLY